MDPFLLTQVQHKEAAKLPETHGERALEEDNKTGPAPFGDDLDKVLQRKKNLVGGISTLPTLNIEKSRT